MKHLTPSHMFYFAENLDEGLIWSDSKSKMSYRLKKIQFISIHFRRIKSNVFI